jgi:hypothetical protein
MVRRVGFSAGNMSVSVSAFLDSVRNNTLWYVIHPIKHVLYSLDPQQSEMPHRQFVENGRGLADCSEAWKLSALIQIGVCVRNM